MTGTRMMCYLCAVAIIRLRRGRGLRGALPPGAESLQTWARLRSQVRYSSNQYMVSTAVLAAWADDHKHAPIKRMLPDAPEKPAAACAERERGTGHRQ